MMGKSWVSVVRRIIVLYVKTKIIMKMPALSFQEYVTVLFPCSGRVWMGILTSAGLFYFSRRHEVSIHRLKLKNTQTVQVTKR